jgi:ribosomal protein S18 acetylase RimI-like enzyme
MYQAEYPPLFARQSPRCAAAKASSRPRFPCQDLTIPGNQTAPTFMRIADVSPASPEAQQLIRELNDAIVALYPGAPIDAVDISEFPSAGGYFVIAKVADEAVGCGGFRRVNDRFAEMKRLFVRETFRRRGIARQILRHLEAEVRRRRYQAVVLEAGADDTAAIALFEAEGYAPIRAFRGDAGRSGARCFTKDARS